MPTKHNIASLLKSARCDRIDAEILLAHICKRERAVIIAHGEATVSQKDAEHFLALTQRRTNGEPLAYLTGEKEFYGRTFSVTPATLIPRADTETLVARALDIAQEHIATKEKPLIIVDVGTGSGAIITTLATELATTTTQHACGFIATDTSKDALLVAHNNACTFDVADQIAFIHADLLAPLLTNDALRRMLRLGAHLLICANLPYIDNSTKDHILAQPESRALAFEPAEALWANNGGLAMYEQLLTQIAKIHRDAPRSPIIALCEIDPTQKKRLSRKILHTFSTEKKGATQSNDTTTHLQSHTDLSHRTRVVEFSVKRQ